MTIRHTIEPTPDLPQWRKAYRQAYKRDPPKRIEALKILNQQSIKRRTADQPISQSETTGGGRFTP
jgi:hypothetical protein